MKILILSDGIPPYIMGGMQRHTANLVKYLVLSGVKVELIHCYNELEKSYTHQEVEFELFGKNNVEGFHSHMLSFPKPGKIPGHYIRRSYSYSKLVFEKIKDRIDDFDLVYIKGFSGWKLLQEKNQFKTKMLVNFHGYEMFQISPDFKTRIRNQILLKPTQKNLSMADFVMSYGGGIDKLLMENDIPKEKILSVSGALDDHWLENVEFENNHERLKLLFVGRYERRKGIEELHKILPTLINESDFDFSFVGPIPEDKRIQHERIKYMGEVKSVDDLKSVYRNNDILIAPSYSEGMPNVIMEAMSQGLAILSTDVGATSLLVSEDNGWLMPKMGEEELRVQMEKILKSSLQDLQAKKESSYKKIRKGFSWKEIAQKHIEIFSARCKVQS